MYQSSNRDICIMSPLPKLAPSNLYNFLQASKHFLTLNCSEHVAGACFGSKLPRMHQALTHSLKLVQISSMEQMKKETNPILL